MEPLGTRGDVGSNVVRFDQFTLDLRTGELWKAGAAVRLQPQPAKILALLAGRAGQLVTREEIRDRIWGKDTFVEFDQSLNFCIRQLRAALGDTADAPRFIETLPRRGYRFLATVSGPEPERNSTRPPTPPARVRSLPVRARILLVSAALVAACAGALVAWRSLRAGGEGDQEPVLLAVLPFKNLSGDADQDYLGEGLTDEMITRLGQVRPDRLRVIARTSAMQYRGSPKAITQIGRELGVAYVVEGSVRRHQDRLRVNVQLVDVGTQALVWAKSFEREVDEIAVLEADVVIAVSDGLQVPLGGTRSGGGDSASHGVDSQTYEAYLKGRYFWRRLTKEDLERAIGYFEEATRRSPDYAPAFTGLADAYYALSNLHLDPAEAMTRAGDAAHRALQLDPNLAEAHCSAALIRLYHRWDWPGAERAFKRAIELNPGGAEIRNWYGVYLALMGRQDESLAELEHARALDPLSLLVNWTMGLPLYFSGRYDEGIQRTRLALELEPGFYLGHAGLGSLYEAKGDYPRAIAEFRLAAASSDSPEIVAYLGRALGLAGKQTEARSILEKLTSEASSRHVSPYDLALVHDALGDHERAIDSLQEAFRRRDEPMIGLRLDPRMRRLLADRRVVDLVRRMGLPDPR